MPSLRSPSVGRNNDGNRGHLEDAGPERDASGGAHAVRDQRDLRFGHLCTLHAGLHSVLRVPRREHIQMLREQASRRGRSDHGPPGVPAGEAAKTVAAGVGPGAQKSRRGSGSVVMVDHDMAGFLGRGGRRSRSAEDSEKGRWQQGEQPQQLPLGSVSSRPRSAPPARRSVMEADYSLPDPSNEDSTKTQLTDDPFNGESDGKPELPLPHIDQVDVDQTDEPAVVHSMLVPVGSCFNAGFVRSMQPPKAQGNYPWGLLQILTDDALDSTVLTEQRYVLFGDVIRLRHMFTGLFLSSDGHLRSAKFVRGQAERDVDVELDKLWASQKSGRTHGTRGAGPQQSGMLLQSTMFRILPACGIRRSGERVLHNDRVLLESIDGMLRISPPVEDVPLTVEMQNQQESSLPRDLNTGLPFRDARIVGAEEYQSELLFQVFDTSSLFAVTNSAQTIAQTSLAAQIDLNDEESPDGAHAGDPAQETKHSRMAGDKAARMSAFSESRPIVAEEPVSLYYKEAGGLLHCVGLSTTNQVGSSQGPKSAGRARRAMMEAAAKAMAGVHSNAQLPCIDPDEDALLFILPLSEEDRTGGGSGNTAATSARRNGGAVGGSSTAALTPNALFSFCLSAGSDVGGTVGLSVMVKIRHQGSRKFLSLRIGGSTQRSASVVVARMAHGERVGGQQFVLTADFNDPGTDFYIRNASSENRGVVSAKRGCHIESAAFPGVWLTPSAMTGRKSASNPASESRAAISALLSGAPPSPRSQAVMNNQLLTMYGNDAIPVEMSSQGIGISDSLEIQLPFKEQITMLWDMSNLVTLLKRHLMTCADLLEKHCAGQQEVAVPRPGPGPAGTKKGVRFNPVVFGDEPAGVPQGNSAALSPDTTSKNDGNTSPMPAVLVKRLDELDELLLRTVLTIAEIDSSDPADERGAARTAEQMYTHELRVPEMLMNIIRRTQANLPTKTMILMLRVLYWSAKGSHKYASRLAPYIGQFIEMLDVPKYGETAAVVLAEVFANNPTIIDVIDVQGVVDLLAERYLDRVASLGCAPLSPCNPESSTTGTILEATVFATNRSPPGVQSKEADDDKGDTDSNEHVGISELSDGRATVVAYLQFLELLLNSRRPGTIPYLQNQIATFFRKRRHEALCVVRKTQPGRRSTSLGFTLESSGGAAMISKPEKQGNNTRRTSCRPGEGGSWTSVDRFDLDAEWRRLFIAQLNLVAAVCMDSCEQGCLLAGEICETPELALDLYARQRDLSFELRAAFATLVLHWGMMNSSTFSLPVNVKIVSDGEPDPTSFSSAPGKQSNTSVDSYVGAFGTTFPPASVDDFGGGNQVDEFFNSTVRREAEEDEDVADFSHFAAMTVHGRPSVLPSTFSEEEEDDDFNIKPQEEPSSSRSVGESGADGVFNMSMFSNDPARNFFESSESSGEQMPSVELVPQQKGKAVSRAALTKKRSGNVRFTDAASSSPQALTTNTSEPTGNSFGGLRVVNANRSFVAQSIDSFSQVFSPEDNSDSPKHSASFVEHILGAVTAIIRDNPVLSVGDYAHNKFIMTTLGVYRAAMRARFEIAFTEEMAQSLLVLLDPRCDNENVVSVQSDYAVEEVEAYYAVKSEVVAILQEAISLQTSVDINSVVSGILNSETAAYVDADVDLTACDQPLLQVEPNAEYLAAVAERSNAGLRATSSSGEYTPSPMASGDFTNGTPVAGAASSEADRETPAALPNATFDGVTPVSPSGGEVVPPGTKTSATDGRVPWVMTVLLSLAGRKCPIGNAALGLLFSMYDRTTAMLAAANDMTILFDNSHVMLYAELTAVKKSLLAVLNDSLREDIELLSVLSDMKRLLQACRKATYVVRAVEIHKPLVNFVFFPEKARINPSGGFSWRNEDVVREAADYLASFAAGDYNNAVALIRALPTVAFSVNLNTAKVLAVALSFVEARRILDADHIPRMMRKALSLALYAKSSTMLRLCQQLCRAAVAKDTKPIALRYVVDFVSLNMVVGTYHEGTSPGRMELHDSVGSRNEHTVIDWHGFLASFHDDGSQEVYTGPGADALDSVAFFVELLQLLAECTSVSLMTHVLKVEELVEVYNQPDVYPLELRQSILAFITSYLLRGAPTLSPELLVKLGTAINRDLAVSADVARSVREGTKFIVEFATPMVIAILKRGSQRQRDDSEKAARPAKSPWSAAEEGITPPIRNANDALSASTREGRMHGLEKAALTRKVTSTQLSLLRNLSTALLRLLNDDSRSTILKRDRLLFEAVTSVKVGLDWCFEDPFTFSLADGPVLAELRHVARRWEEICRSDLVVGLDRNERIRVAIRTAVGMREEQEDVSCGLGASLLALRRIFLGGDISSDSAGRHALSKRALRLVRLFRNEELSPGNTVGIMRLLTSFLVEPETDMTVNKSRFQIELRRLQDAQSQIADSGVVRKLLQLIMDESRPALQQETLKLCVGVLNWGNVDVQRKIELCFRSTMSAAFFIQVRALMQKAHVDISKSLHLLAAVGDSGGGSPGSDSAYEADSSTIVKEHTAALHKIVSMVAGVIRFLQLLCEGHNKWMQDYLREQLDNVISVDLVKEVVIFARHLFRNHLCSHTFPLALQLLDTLTELCQGPNPTNQRTLVRFRVIAVVEAVMLGKTENQMTLYLKPDEHDILIRGCIQMLMSLLEGIPPEGEVALSLFKPRLIDRIIILMNDMWIRTRLKAKRRSWQKKQQVDQVAPLSVLGGIVNAVESAVEGLVAGISAEDPMGSKVDSQILLDIGVQSYIYLVALSTLLPRGYALSPRIRQQACFAFYSHHVASVEISRAQHTERIFFQVPPHFYYLPERSKGEFQTHVNRESTTAKLQGLLSSFDNLSIECHAYYTASRHPALRLLSHSALEFISMFLSLAISVMALFTANRRNDPRHFYMSSSASVGFAVLSLTQVALETLLFGVWIFFRARVIVMRQVHARVQEILRVGQRDKVRAQELRHKWRRYVELSTAMETGAPLATSNTVILTCMVLPRVPELYTAILFFVSPPLGLLIHPIFSTLQTFRVVDWSESLQNVVLAVTSKAGDLFTTIFLGVVVVFGFTMLSFTFFDDRYFNPQRNPDQGFGFRCEHVSECFAQNIVYGLRQGGGIGDLMGHPSWDMDDAQVIGQILFTFSFWIIMVVIFLNIVFGIILDTFAELRDKKQARDLDKRTVCFICGREAYEFDKDGRGFRQHYKQEHNMWHYFAFYLYLEGKPYTEYTGQESYVYRRCRMSDISFFPIERALSLERRTTDADATVFTSVNKVDDEREREIRIYNLVYDVRNTIIGFNRIQEQDAARRKHQAEALSVQDQAKRGVNVGGDATLPATEEETLRSVLEVAARTRKKLAVIRGVLGPNR